MQKLTYQDHCASLVIKLFYSISLLLIISCSDSEISESRVEDRYVALEKLLTSDYNALAAGLRNKKTDFSNKQSVTTIAFEQYRESSDSYRAFIVNYERASNVSTTRTFSYAVLSTIQETKIKEIVASANIYTSSAEFKSYLDNQFEKIFKSSIDNTDKDFLLTYIISYKTTLTFLENNSDLILSSQAGGRTEKKESWWNSWGKCAAGIVGGAGSVGLGGFLGGAAVGTVTLPVVGTVSGAVVGGVGGAIFGGLAGAASAC
jgi:hypothetical protein